MISRKIVGHSWGPLDLRVDTYEMPFDPYGLPKLIMEPLSPKEAAQFDRACKQLRIGVGNHSKKTVV